MLSTMYKCEQDDLFPGSGNNMKKLILFFFLLMGCSQIPLRGERPHITQYVLDPASGTLRAEEESNDLPLKYCDSDLCLVLTDSEMRKIESYVILLEQENAACRR